AAIAPEKVSRAVKVVAGVQRSSRVSSFTKLLRRAGVREGRRIFCRGRRLRKTDEKKLRVFIMAAFPMIRVRKLRPLRPNREDAFSRGNWAEHQRRACRRAPFFRPAALRVALSEIRNE